MKEERKSRTGGSKGGDEGTKIIEGRSKEGQQHENKAEGKQEEKRGTATRE